MRLFKGWGVVRRASRGLVAAVEGLEGRKLLTEIPGVHMPGPYGQDIYIQPAPVTSIQPPAVEPPPTLLYDPLAGMPSYPSVEYTNEVTLAPVIHVTAAVPNAGPDSLFD